MNILPREPGFAELFGQGLSQGFVGEQDRRQSLADQYSAQRQKGLLDLYNQDQLQKQKYGLKKELIDKIYDGSSNITSQQPGLSEYLNDSYNPTMENENLQSNSTQNNYIPTFKDIQSGNIVDQSIGRTLQAQRDEGVKKEERKDQRFIEDRKYHSAVSDKAIEEVDQLRENQRLKQNALNLAKEAIETNETGPSSWSNIAKRFNLPELMDSSGAKLNQAGKQFFFGNMTRLSAKAQNVWLEQMISGLAAQVGDPKEVALMKNTILQGEKDLDQAYIETFDRLAQDDINKYGYVKRDIKKRAFDESEKLSQDIMKKISYKTREIYESSKDISTLLNEQVPNGTFLTKNMLKEFMKKFNYNKEAVLDEVKKLGYTIPTRQDVERWN